MCLDGAPPPVKSADGTGGTWEKCYGEGQDVSPKWPRDKHKLDPRVGELLDKHADLFLGGHSLSEVDVYVDVGNEGEEYTSCYMAFNRDCCARSYESCRSTEHCTANFWDGTPIYESYYCGRGTLYGCEMKACYVLRDQQSVL